LERKGGGLETVKGKRVHAGEKEGDTSFPWPAEGEDFREATIKRGGYAPRRI